MIPAPKKAFLLCAGLGTRLRPHTDTMPKPMVPVAGRAIIDRALDKLVAAGVEDVWVNLHYLPDVLQSHLLRRNDVKIHFSEEKTLLDTGGGVKKCLKDIGNDPFYVINGDSLWVDGTKPALVRLYEAFDSSKTDILMLLQATHRMNLTGSVGDYDGVGTKAQRNHEKQGQYMFTGIRIVHPRIFDYPASSLDIFSFLALMDEAEKQGRLEFIENDGEWHHISTPQDLAAVDAHLRESS